jgi:hypothetical protein
MKNYYVRMPKSGLDHLPLEHRCISKLSMDTVDFHRGVSDYVDLSLRHPKMVSSNESASS